MTYYYKSFQRTFRASTRLTTFTRAESTVMIHPTASSCSQQSNTSSCVGTQPGPHVQLDTQPSNQANQRTYTYMHLPVYILTHHASTIQALLYGNQSLYRHNIHIHLAIKQHSSCPVLVACTSNKTTMLHDERLPHSPYQRPRIDEEVADLPSSFRNT